MFFSSMQYYVIAIFKVVGFNFKMILMPLNVTLQQP